MKIRFGIAALGLVAVFAAAPVPLYAQFEGAADFQVTFHRDGVDGTRSTGKMYVSHAGYRTEWEMSLPFGPGRRETAAAPAHLKMTLVGRKADPDHVYMVNDENKTYSVMDLKKIREESAKNADNRTYTVEKLGNDTVAGITCQKAAVTSSKGDVFDVCVSKDWFADPDLISSFTRNRRSGAWIAALKDSGLPGFPIRFSTRPKADATATMTWELTHVERKAPPASLFDVPPPGYKQTEYAVGGLSPEQQKAIDGARARMRENMTPEQRKAYEDSLRKPGEPTPTPTP
jgi:hypothetical protein